MECWTIDSKSMFYAQEQQYTPIFNTRSPGNQGEKSHAQQTNTKTANFHDHSCLVNLKLLLFFHVSFEFPSRYQKPSNQPLKKDPIPSDKVPCHRPVSQLNAKQWVLAGNDALSFLFFFCSRACCCCFPHGGWAHR